MRHTAPQATGASMADDASSEMTAEQKKAMRDEKKKQKEAEKAAKEARKREEQEALKRKQDELEALSKDIEFLSVEEGHQPTQLFGTYKVIRSACASTGSGRTFTPIESLGTSLEGQHVWCRARVANVRGKGKAAFLVLRQMRGTAQALVEESDIVPRDMIKWISKEITAESIVDVFGLVKLAEVKSCTVSDVELFVSRLYLVSKADPLPFLLEDAARPAHVDGAHVLRDTRLDNRAIDLRVPAHKAIMRVQGGVCALFREHLSAKSFIEIHSPKLISGASEGGANVFQLDYFGLPACLAQSPQLYKQMAICADFERVFEIGHVFRAEKSNTHRHLTEFIGLDIEMQIDEHYMEVMRTLDHMFVAIFDGLTQHFRADLDTVAAQYPFEPLRYKPAGENIILEFPEGVRLLREAGYEIGDHDDMNTELERALGSIVKEKYDTDFFILCSFPSAVRPFYTMPSPTNPDYSNSFDVFIRGEEIVSGAQRIHVPEMLIERAKGCGIDLDTIKDYVDAFRYGAPPHGGAGVGLERVVMLYLALPNVRECCLFARDPKRLTP
ncbi:Aspartate--tRNA ligase, cytoplasmic [Porphyridium purpureum]|uniref:aspartate--tRNA ligase n=1 Tax=Porphyridium purpureum TaxID=35688 RepID=A0A5J4YLJ7_PORPP|nr:Aspartate--tRNA ligase, cytoplasmic [Porphyridium purpureum]|eukprot:POR2818..scf291_13